MLWLTDGQTDRQTDGRTDGRHTIICPKFHFGCIKKIEAGSKNECGWPEKQKIIFCLMVCCYIVAELLANVFS